MKIQNRATQQPIVRSQDGKTTDRSATGEAARSSSVQLSDARRQLAGVRAPESRERARVEHLEGLVLAGKLTVDAHAIADAMLREIVSTA